VLRTRSGRTLSARARRFRIPAGYAAVVVLPLNPYAKRLLRGARAVRVAAVVRP
jgi:hypothetical protein